MLALAGQYTVESPIAQDTWTKVKVKVNNTWIDVRMISPTDGKELREKDKQLNGEPNHTRGIPSFWWRSSSELIEFWPAASHDLEIGVQNGEARS